MSSPTSPATSPNPRLAQLWHSIRGSSQTQRTKQQNPALHELVKPYLDVLIPIRDVEAGGSNPLTPTKNPLLRRGVLIFSIDSASFTGTDLAHGYCLAYSSVFFSGSMLKT